MENNKKISVYIVEDYLLTRVTYKQAMKDYPQISVEGDFDTAEACIEALESKQVDVILMDLGLPYMTGIEATKIIHRKYPDIKIIILTSHENDNEVLSSLASGANAYALKDIDTKKLINLIQTVNEGSIWIDPRITKIVQKTFYKAEPVEKEDFNLTPREKEVLDLLIQGFSNTEIADRLTVTSHTAKAHVCNILEKLSVTDRVQAAVKATKYDL
ncbi:MAG: response regulator transcription factor [Candidatus Gastranaerophilaceae bacterium]|nr:response regulator transcription factor [Candidatus Gastranaerophilaceae bacterium]